MQPQHLHAKWTACKLHNMMITLLWHEGVCQVVAQLLMVQLICGWSGYCGAANAVCC
jgi:hypothetical protein